MFFFFFFLSFSTRENENGRDFFSTKDENWRKSPENILLQLFCNWLMDGSRKKIPLFKPQNEEAFGLRGKAVCVENGNNFHPIFFVFNSFQFLFLCSFSRQPFSSILEVRWWKAAKEQLNLLCLILKFFRCWIFCFILQMFVWGNTYEVGGEIRHLQNYYLLSRLLIFSHAMT